MGKKFIFILLALFVSMSVAFAQNTVRGVVYYSEDGSPIAGASVIVEGTTIGTYANENGEFFIANVPTSAEYLIVSLLGMQEMRVKIASNVEVTLYPDSNLLDETVIVAYGSQTKRSITGSVAVVDSKKIELHTATSATGALEGSAPGIQVNNTYGEPGAAPKIRIRGIGSISGSNDPLFVVDGVVFEGNISEINPVDIASISVLKDAASSALYGSRAANGVVLITTKSGSGSSEPAITVKINQGLYERGIPEYATLGPDSWMEASWLAMKNYAMSGSLQYDEAKAKQYATEHLIGDYARRNIYNEANNALFDENGKLIATRNPNYNDLDWYDPIQRVGKRSEYAVSGSVATSKYNVYASMSYLKEEGYIIGTDYERFSGRISTNFTPNKWFKTGFNISATSSDRNYNDNATGSYYANPFSVARTMAPVYPYYLHDPRTGEIVLDEDGNKVYDTTSDYLDNRNIAFERRRDFNKTHRNVLGGQAYATITFPYGIQATFRGDLNHSNTNRHEYNNPEIGDGAANDGRFNNYSYRYMTFTGQELLTWDHNFGLHHVDLLAGHENYKHYISRDYSMNTNMAVPDVYVMSNFLTNSYTQGYDDNDRIESYLARVRYNYDEKYFVDASVRRDGSSRFHKDARWGTFYSFGASWNIKKEDFLKDVDAVDELKLRFALGSVGNNRIGSAETENYYPYQALYEIDKNGGKTALLKRSLSANDLSWETTRTLDFAVEGSFFQNRLNASLGYFDKKSLDLLLSVPLPLSAGSWAHYEDDYNLSINKNCASISNSGIELSVNGDAFRTKDWTLSLGVEATFLRNKILKLYDGSDIINGSIRRYSVGKSIYEFYTYKFQGVDQLTGRSLYTIDPVYEAEASENGELVEINGIKYTTDTSYGLKDWSGSAIPDVYGSFTTALRYKNFTVNALFTWSLGGKTYDGIYQDLMSTNSAASASAIHSDAVNGWNGIPSQFLTAGGEIMNEAYDSPHRISKHGIPALDFNRSTKNNATSDRWLTDNSYFVIKTINVGYRFPKSVVNKLDLKGLQVNASVENLASFSARQGMNPQYGFNGGYDNTYVTARVYNLGLTINF